MHYQPQSGKATKARNGPLAEPVSILKHLQRYFDLLLLLSFQLFVFTSGLLQDRDVRISILPDCKEILIGFACLCRVPAQDCGACQAQVRERVQRRSGLPTSMVEYLLKLVRSVSALLLIEVRLTTQVGDLEKGVSFIRSGRLQQLNRLRRITFLQFNAGLNQRNQDLIKYSVFRRTPGQICNDTLTLAEVVAGSQCGTGLDHPQRTMRPKRPGGLLLHLLAVAQQSIPSGAAYCNLRCNLFQVAA